MTAPTEPTGQQPGEPAAQGTTEKPEDAGRAGGDKAILADLKAEREARKVLEKQIKALEDRDPLKAIAEALGAKPGEAKGDDLAATVKQMQQQMQAAELKALRLEVAAEKGLTPQQAARLQGATREELAADADALKELFPTPAQGAPAGNGSPAPDPSQGARGGGADLHAAIAAAREKGDVMESIRLQRGLLDTARAKQQ